MKIRALVLIVLTFAAGGAFAAGAGWTPYTSKEFRFAALFPVAPKVETSTEKSNVAGKMLPVTMHQFLSKGANGTLCLVVHSLYSWPIDIEGELVADRDNFAKGVSATVTTSKRTTLARGATALPAMLFDAKGPTYLFRSLVVLDAESVYEVAAGVPIGGGNTADLDRCVKGFALTVGK